ncbi:hypothetical protein QQP08_026362 [Theobroma cacao]|nr:hypothetical protein QQP08_026362 [Theobroma cacao]
MRPSLFFTAYWTILHLHQKLCA